MGTGTGIGIGAFGKSFSESLLPFLQIMGQQREKETEAKREQDKNKLTVLLEAIKADPASFYTAEKPGSGRIPEIGATLPTPERFDEQIAGHPLAPVLKGYSRAVFNKQMVEKQQADFKEGWDIFEKGLKIYGEYRKKGNRLHSKLFMPAILSNMNEGLKRMGKPVLDIKADDIDAQDKIEQEIIENLVKARASVLRDPEMKNREAYDRIRFTIGQYMDIPEHLLTIQEHEFTNAQDLAIKRARAQAELDQTRAQTGKIRQEKKEKFATNLYVAGQAAGISPEKIMSGMLTPGEAQAVGQKYKEMFGGDINEISAALHAVIGTKIKRKLSEDQKKPSIGEYLFGPPKKEGGGGSIPRSSVEGRQSALQSLNERIKGMNELQQRAYLNQPEVKAYMEKHGIEVRVK